MTEGIFAVLYVSIMGLTRFYKTADFLHLLRNAHIVRQVFFQLQFSAAESWVAV